MCYVCVCVPDLLDEELLFIGNDDGNDADDFDREVEAALRKRAGTSGAVAGGSGSKASPHRSRQAPGGRQGTSRSRPSVRWLFTHNAPVFSALSPMLRLCPALACSSRHNGLGVLQDLVSTPPMPPWLPSTARKPRQVAVAESVAAASKAGQAAVGHDHDLRCPVSQHRQCITVDDPRSWHHVRHHSMVAAPRVRR